MIRDGEIVDVSTAARLLGLHEETLRRMARDGNIPAFKVGRGWRFNRSTLHTWAEAQRQPVPRKRVLVIDDDELDLELTSAVIEKAGFTAVMASNGVKALEIMRQHVPDVVLLDLKMPGMDGPTVMREIRKAHGFVPVIISTAYPDSDLVAKALEHGPVTLLLKPVEAERLHSAIGMVMSKDTKAQAGSGKR